MGCKLKSFLSYEFFLLLLLVAFVATIGLVNPAFFSIGTLFDVIRNQTVYLLLAFGLLPVVIMGGLDISFVAIAAMVTFPASIVLINTGYGGGMWLFYLLAMIVGISAGLFIGWLIWTFKLAIFDLSLGMSSIIFGLLAFSSGSRTTSAPLPALVGWNQKWILSVQSVAGQSSLHISFLLIVFIFLGLHLFLRYTTSGRAIYAVGSDKSVAIRTGIDVRKIILIVFALMGTLAAVAGVTNAGLGFGNASFVGKFLRVYAMVIIGGASIHGGKGSVLGTMLGVILVGLIDQSLVYLSIPTAWGDAVLGTIFIAFTTYQTLANRLRK